VLQDNQIQHAERTPEKERVASRAREREREREREGIGRETERDFLYCCDLSTWERKEQQHGALQAVTYCQGTYSLPASKTRSKPSE
jgi:hypothetical protein